MSLSPNTVAILIDLLGDGLPGWWFDGQNLPSVKMVQIFSPRKGTFRLQITSYTSEGCWDQTGVVREVVVR